ncbi:hypothetical protein CKM354_000254500 [Cercospora kikuchii]|uniref:F-box domain-containing protein n=1 Tax=Cercospora kikuchii TaxID=84275 RepID=A0A9P3CA42_9PEZI|nr:uncharacterized protein CKM354_000254500 [Cercospora kikuchii]GIZ39154.1 hypothetical protein CKM354_000254500 [Cercospora kikuchii]
MLTTESKAQDGESRQNKALPNETAMECPPSAATPPDDAEETVNYRQSSVNLVGASSEVAEPAKEYSLGLLDLPADLRNIIYEYSLLQPDRIQITSGLKQPALLATCRQIRSETRMMWFWRNKFTYTAVDCNVRLLYAFHTLYGGPLPRDVCVIVYASGRLNWKALMEWCKFVFEHKRHCFRVTNPWSGRQVMRAATLMALEPGAANWNDCERALQLWRPVAALVHPEWARVY